MPSVPPGTDPDLVAAQQETRRILTAFLPPPGSVPSAAQPEAVPGGLLDHAPQRMQGPENVAATTWYVSSMSPQDVLDWLTRHPPTGSGPAGGGTGDGVSPAFASFPIQQPWIPPTVLADRSLVASPAKGADGRTVIRLDAEVTYFPARSAAEHIPASAKSVTVTATNTLNPIRTTLPQPVTASDPGVVSQIIAAVDTLPVMLPGMSHCAADMGTRVTLTFRSAPGGPVVAELVATSGGCGDVTVSIGGAKLPTLWGAQTGFIEQVYQALGVSWDPSS